VDSPKVPQVPPNIFGDVTTRLIFSSGYVVVVLGGQRDHKVALYSSVGRVRSVRVELQIRLKVDLIRKSRDLVTGFSQAARAGKSWTGWLIEPEPRLVVEVRYGLDRV
jgi:hypothetical protein